MENSHFSVQIKGFQLLGLSCDTLKEKPRLLLLLYFAIAIPLFFCFFPVGFYVIQNYQDVSASAEATGILLTGILGFSKLVTFCASKESFFIVIDNLNEIFQQGSFFP